MSNQNIGQVDGCERGLGIVTGVLWAIAVGILGETAQLGCGDEWQDLLPDVYLGYDSMMKELIIGFFEACVDAFVGEYTLTGLHNRIRPSKNQSDQQSWI
jgi:hypothetical protein